VCTGYSIQFSEVNANSLNLSTLDITVIDIVAEPTHDDSNIFLVTVLDGTEYKFFEIQVSDAAAESYNIFEKDWDSLIPVRNLHIFDINDEHYLFVATDRGIAYKQQDLSPTDEWKWVTPEILGNFDITRIFDYNGNLGMIAKDNGLIYGPYPEP